jgi:hypothetical protein
LERPAVLEEPGLIKEFRGLPPGAKLDLVREHGLCSRCLSHCDPKGERMHKRCRLKSRIEKGVVPEAAQMQADPPSVAARGCRGREEPADSEAG